ncbi:hypothetical protein VitviT2T_002874 [Vitis vinifera]|uniref:FCP1 homology domain-containing protein n=2 Tax=Vitis vinifera TaxID=29760 RepID=A0ABY9BKQ9_VITVI|nr:uncharacterized protein LOC104877755 [Vitis vinifera]RVX02084.1 hypothetical protein CK203_025367 [Vitis vinifera]WJZ83169.1 hypothetical protein VitviT2T_002874 [Vitis vinifera]|eukprot:XP_010644919.1 PREDICTED: uncharacterized protein LOC104877755 [Vitis vinifera]
MSPGYQSCDIDYFNISDITLTGLPIEGSAGFHDMVTGITPSLIQSLGDAASLEDAVGTSNIHSAELYEKPWMNSDEICFQLLQDGRRTIYMRQRPFLPIFFSRVAEMFEIIVFTANQSIYAEQLLDKMEGVGYTNIAVYRSVEEDIT